MKIICPECKRFLEQNTENFVLSCDGYWRKKCRDCQNKRKRQKYRRSKNKKTRGKNPYRIAREKRLEAKIKEYTKIFKTLDKLGVSIDTNAEFVDKVLENASKLKRKGA